MCVLHNLLVSHVKCCHFTFCWGKRASIPCICHLQIALYPRNSCYSHKEAKDVKKNMNSLLSTERNEVLANVKWLPWGHAIRKYLKVENSGPTLEASNLESEAWFTGSCNSLVWSCKHYPLKLSLCPKISSTEVRGKVEGIISLT